MSPSAIPVAKQVIRQVRAADMRRIAHHVLRMATIAEIEHYLLASLGDIVRQAGDQALPPDGERVKGTT